MANSLRRFVLDTNVIVSAMSFPSRFFLIPLF
jgi:hypothetical protein